MNDNEKTANRAGDSGTFRLRDWRRFWRDFLTAGGRVDADDPDYLRLTLLNMMMAASLLILTMFLCLHLLDVVEGSTGRVVLDVVGILIAVAVITSLRREISTAMVAEIVNALLFFFLVAIMVVRNEDHLVILTLPLIYPALGFLLLDNVRKGCIWTLVMILGANSAVFLHHGAGPLDRPPIFDDALTASLGVFFVAAVMALYLHHRKLVMARLLAVSAELSHTATHDPLTGLLNRRTFDETLDHELARRDPRPLGFLFFDLDRFKAYNDHYGHVAGDELLCRVSAAIGGLFNRREDYKFRLGGEEFGVVYRNSTETRLEAMAARLLAVIEELAEPAPAGPREYVTASAGLAVVVDSRRLDVDAVYRLADRALYRAKNEGRARWVRAESGDAAVTTPP